MRSRTFRLALVGCTALGLFLRVGRALERPLIHPDGPGYIEVARMLAPGRWPAALTGYYPPGFPLALRAAHGLGLEWEAAGRAVAVVTGAMTVPATGALGSAIFGPPVGVGAALLAAVHPRMIRASAEVLPETAYGLIVVLWALPLFRTPVPTGRIAAAAVLAALSYLVRVEGLALVPLTALAATLGTPPRTRVRRAAFAVSVSAAILLPIGFTIARTTGVWAMSGKEVPIIARRWGIEGSSLLALVTRHPGALLGTYPRFLFRQITYTLGVLHALLIVPIALGFATRASDPVAARARRLTLATVGVFTLGIALLNPGKRYVVPFVPLLLPWAALGARRLAALVPAGTFGHRASLVGAAAVLIVLGISGLKRPDPFEETCFRSVCTWVARHVADPPPPFITSDGRLPYLCGARFVPEPPRGGAEAVLARGRALGGAVWLVKRWRRPAPALVDGIVAIGERCGQGIAIYEIRAP
jgi:hypothetical protein